VKLAAVADTHTVLWYVFADARISKIAREAIDNAAAEGLYVGVSIISLAEIVYLIEKERISATALDRVLEVCRNPERVLVEVPLDSNIIERMPGIPRTEVPDLPDRLVAATALFLKVPVITRDGLIRAANLETIW
jgi:PIN domain nuclease of toxin-antitoxin system